jgi:hypothetical protein
MTIATMIKVSADSTDRAPNSKNTAQATMLMETPKQRNVETM